MAAPGIITGGKTATQLFRRVSTGTEPVSGLGVFGKNPGATPKYAINQGRGGRDAEKRDTMARLFINVPKEQTQSFLDSLSPETRPLARVLMAGSEFAGGSGTGFIDFLLTEANETFVEKKQIVDTLTDNYTAYYSGQEPPEFMYSGVLLNTYQDDQRVWMLRLYREILRGTRLAGRNLFVNLRYDSFLVSGYMEALSLGLRGDDSTGSTFRFSLRVKRMTVVTPALGAPTIVETDATNNTILSGKSPDLQSTDYRAGTVSAEVPETPSAMPAAETAGISSAELIEIRQTLRSQGLSDAQIDAQINAAQSLAPVPEVDPREEEFAWSFQGEERVAAYVNGTDATLTNPENVNNDGQGGLTNVRGPDLLSEAMVPLVEVPNNRARGYDNTISSSGDEALFTPG